MKTVGFVGLGLMGQPMAERLHGGGFPLRVWNRTRSKADGLVNAGAVWCDTPRSVAQGVAVVHSMVSTPEALDAISSGPDGIRAGLEKGGVHVDHSTVSPDMTRKLGEAYRANGTFFVHAPVLGSVPQVKEGSLLMFVGGAEDAFAKCRETIGLLGQRIWRFDAVDQATNTKLLCNSFIAGMIVVLSQAFVLAKRVNVDFATVLEIIGQSQLNAPMFQGKGRAMMEGNFTARFFVEHLRKDISLMLDVAEGVKVQAPGLEVALKLCDEAMSAGLAREDYSAIVKVLDRIPGSRC
jgi:3-hydroxyisobutyrate dehydrogenase-like beta-hydroxyacid dehydrogenase